MSLSNMKTVGDLFKLRLKEYTSQLSGSSDGKTGDCFPPLPSAPSSPPPSSPPPTPPPSQVTVDSFHPPPEPVNMERRPMKYPYTLTAKLAQFPLRYYMSNVWMWKYYFVAVGLTLPLFYKIGKLSKSPENVAKWNEIRRKEFTPGHH